ncbi:MAG TPA: DegT/DnrJ/EryC1/StrS family aminotransferase [Pyrinomonadaceae bacterium]|jgi:dTDP-4-amino-4,6-dideoxygalactose transaminase
MRRPKQVIYPIRYFNLSLTSNDSAETHFASNLSAFLGGHVYVQAIGRARAGLYLLAKIAVRDRKRRIIMSPYTIPDVVNMIKFAGAEPVFVDCLRDSTAVDLHQLADVMDDTVCAVLATHYHLNQNMAAIRAICTRKEVMVIDDCALALGATEIDGFIGSTADASVFSFSGFKTLNYFWGGAITTRSAELGRRVSEEVAQWSRLDWSHYRRQFLKLLTYDLVTRDSVFSTLTFPWLRRSVLKRQSNELLPLVRIDSKEIDQTILSRPSLEAFAEWNRKLHLILHFVRHRRTIAAIYDCLLGSFLVGKETAPEIRSGSCWVNYPIRVEPELRTEIYKKVLAQGMDIGLSLYPNVHEMPGFTNIAGRSENVANLVRSVLYLPTHPRISEEYARQLANVVSSSIRVG